MLPTPASSIFLFRLFGVRVFLHYSWIIVAAFQVYYAFQQGRTFGNQPESPAHALLYHALLYLCLFLIVLMHEFGHSLACKSVGGISDTIVLFPFGGVSYVRPPERPGAVLWSIVAGPLVNVILTPLTFGAVLLTDAMGGVLHNFLVDIAMVNLILLIFNMLPVYPLDGGQIFRALLWFIFGRGVSLVIAAGIGLVCGAAGAVGMLLMGHLWLLLMFGFLAFEAYAGLRLGMAMMKLEQAPRRLEVRCPHCLANPPRIPIWRCACGMRFDIFEHGARCPQCGTTFAAITCPHCGMESLSPLWFAPVGTQSPHASSDGRVTARPATS